MTEIDFRTLFEADSFVKTLAFVRGDGCASDAASALVTGYGTLAGRLVFACVDTGGGAAAFGIRAAEKICRVLGAALHHGAPFLLCLGGSGADISAGSETLSAYSELLGALVSASGRIPLICVVSGKCFGIHAAISALCDFTFLVGPEGKFGIASEAAVNAHTGSADGSSAGLNFSYDNAARHAPNVSGVCSDTDALRTRLETLIEYLPDSAGSGTACDGETEAAAYNNGYSTQDISLLRGRELIQALSDAGRFAETGELYGPEAITGFAAFYGLRAGIICFDTSGSDGLTGMQALRKAARFTEFCVRFGLPLVYLVDATGVCAANAREALELPEALAGFIASVRECRNCVTVVTGSACGSVAAALLKRSDMSGAGTIAYAWDSAVIDSINPAAPAQMIYADRIAEADAPAQARKEYIELYKQNYARAVFAASDGLVDDIIAPAETRDRIAAYLKLMW